MRLQKRSEYERDLFRGCVLGTFAISDVHWQSTVQYGLSLIMHASATMTSDSQKPLTTRREQDRVCSGLFQSYELAGCLAGMLTDTLRLLAGFLLSGTAEWQLESTGDCFRPCGGFEQEH